MTLSPSFPVPFGPYLLLSSFGRGGMGEVFLAKRGVVNDVDRACVVKTLRREFYESEHKEEIERRFVDEARLVFQLQHPSICQVFEYGCVGDDHYLAMELILGVPLTEFLRVVQKEGKSLSPGLALYIAEQVLDALAYAHTAKSLVTGQELGVVHRDVTPSNIMLSFDGGVKLIDFGIAASHVQLEETRADVVLGKPSYMSPEQARGKALGPATDQFAAAVTLYEMLMGERYYAGLDAHDREAQIVSGSYAPRRLGEVRALHPVAGPALGDILRRALATLEEDRFPSCGDLKVALENVHADAWPRAGRSELRALLQQTFAAREGAVRDTLARFADQPAPRHEVDARIYVSDPDLTATQPKRKTALVEGSITMPRGQSGKPQPAVTPVSDTAPALAATTTASAAPLSTTASMTALQNANAMRGPFVLAAVIVAASVVVAAWLLVPRAADAPPPPTTSALPTPPLPTEQPVVAPAASATPPTPVTPPVEPTPVRAPVTTSEPAPSPRSVVRNVAPVREPAPAQTAPPATAPTTTTTAATDATLLTQDQLNAHIAAVQGCAINDPRIATLKSFVQNLGTDAATWNADANRSKRAALVVMSGVCATAH